MQDLNDFRLFVDVVEQKGFSAAARKLGMPRSRLSRRIGLLEESLGVRLIQRSTRQFTVTDVGREFYRHCLAMVVEAEAATEAVQRMHGEPRGLVRVSCPSSVIYFQVGAMIARFMAACPYVEIMLDSTNRRVDVIGEGFDMAIRVRFPPLDDSDLVIRKLADSTQRLVASPALVKDFTHPLVPADLATLPSLAWGPANSEHEWCLDGPEGATAKIPHRPRLLTEDMVALREAALAGIGLCQITSLVVHDELKAGRLVEMLPGWAQRSCSIQAAFPCRRGLVSSVRALMVFLAAEYAELSRIEARDSQGS